MDMDGRANLSVVHMAYFYGLNNTGGAAIASTRLHLALLEAGVESHYVCVRKCEEGPQVHELPAGLKRRVYLALTKLLRGVWKLTPRRRPVSLNRVPLFGLERLLRKLRPDVVHVHWLNADVMSFEQLGRLRKAFPRVRFVVNLHDLFMINAIEPYPGADRRYVEGFSKANSTWLERGLLERKKCAIRSLGAPVRGGCAQPLAFVGPSAWAADCCRRSIVGRGVPAHAIPNLISPCFAYRPSLRRAHRKFVILFGAFGGRGNRQKGFDDLVRALSLVPQEAKGDMALRIFGEDAEPCETAGVPTGFCGNVSSPTELVAVYHGADVFAFPSRQETQGMTKAEAMLCGLPVVAFNRTACAEGIEPNVTGSVAESVADFAKGLMFWYAAWQKNAIDHAQIAAEARKTNAEENVLKRIKDVYSAAGSRIAAPLSGGGGYA